MATRIHEGSTALNDGEIPIALHPMTSQAAITATASSQQSAAFASTTEIVIVDTDEAIHILVGKDPTATTANLKIAAGGRYEFGVPRGEGYKVAVIAG